MADFAMRKYPRTPHIEGSRLQPGDEDLSQIPLSELAGQTLVVEEKCDGANSALSFDRGGSLLLQSRGHYLTGGYRERHYDLFKQWASVHRAAFFEVLGSRYILYGEWLYAKHTVYYDNLSHYFMEFDIYDRERGIYLDTGARHALLQGLPVVSAPVLAIRTLHTSGELTELLTRSSFIRPGHITRLIEYCEKNGEDAQRHLRETDPSPLMEGLYLKLERGGEVISRMKYVRASFSQRVDQSGSHWLNRPIIPNRLAYPLEGIFQARLPEDAKTLDRMRSEDT